MIEEEPGRLIEVPGSGPKRTKLIAAAWEEQKAIKEVMVFLQGVGVSTSLAVRIYKKYGDKSIDVVRNEPYRLAADVWGIGFKTADTIAQAVGIPHDSPERVKAGLQYTLSEATDNGHCYLPEQRADRRRDEDPRGRTPGWSIECLAELVAEEGVVRESCPADDGLVGAIYLVPFHRAEISLAGQLLRLLRTAGRPDAALRRRRLGQGAGLAATRTGTTWRPSRTQAVRLALTSKVAVLTGGPGCGKSFTVRSIVKLAAAKNAKIMLAAPDRAGRETADRADRPRGQHRAPAAGAQARRRRRATTGTTRSTPTWSSSTRRPCST